MEFEYIGINYKDAGQDIRDHVSFTDNQKIDFLQKTMEAGIRQCMVLSTCNRSDVFFFSPEPEKKEQDQGILVAELEKMGQNQNTPASEYLNRTEETRAKENGAEENGAAEIGAEGNRTVEIGLAEKGVRGTEVPASRVVIQLYEEMFPELEGAQMTSYLREKSGDEALSYLFRVAAGLESMVLGEDQILGQVKEAFELSKTLGCTGKELNKVVRDAVTCAKKMKTQLHISEKPLSVSYVGIRQVKDQFGIEGRRALVVGSGKTAVLALKYLYEYKAAAVTVCSRTFSHARELLKDFPQLTIIPFEKRYEAMKECEIVVSATSSPHHVIRKNQVDFSHPKVFLDLASPRDVETAIGQEAMLFNLDSLGKIVESNRKEREELVEKGQEMIDESLAETKEWLEVTGVDATIESMQQRCEEIVADSFSYLNRKLDLSPREQKILKKILKASLHRLVREPILELKQARTKEQQETYERTLQELFHL
ncbi:MAG: glutamyl-tRNA reductase [Lachnospiraceae bacterium]|nr:glutamyl-tRNA reductase [Lachnospiraceae bacterium]